MAITMPAGKSRLVPILAALLLWPCLGAAAQEGASPEGVSPEVTASGSVLLFPILLRAVDPSAGEDAQAFGEALRSGLGRNLQAAGYSLIDEKDPLSSDVAEPAQASERALKAGAGWAAVCELSLVEGRIAYRVALYDAEDGTLASGDSFSALAGLAFIPLMNDATARVAQRLAGYQKEKVGTPRRLVSYRVVVTCPIEGASVSVDSPGASSRSPAGEIRNGRLELPYYPFLVGSTLYVSASAKGRARMRAEIKLGSDAAAVELKPPKPRMDLLVGTGTGRLLGAGGEYRLYLAPEWNFLLVDERVYAGYDFLKGSSPLVHDELWNGLGWYLFFPPSSKFRMGYSIGYGALISMRTAPGSGKRVFCDFAVRPIDLFGEYDLGKDRAVWLSLASAFSVGTGGSGLLGREWIGGGAPSISAGMLWRRR